MRYIIPFLLLSACAETIPHHNCNPAFQDEYWEIPKHISDERGEDPTCFSFASDGKFWLWNEADEGYSMDWECKDNGNLSLGPWSYFQIERRSQDTYRVDVQINIEEKPRLFKHYSGIARECDLDNDGLNEEFSL